MLYEYDYYPGGYQPSFTTKTLEEALNVTYDVDYIHLAIEFTVSPYIPPKFTGHPDTWCEEEGGELEVQSIYPMYLTTTYDDIPVTIHKREREIIGDYIDEEVIKEECWKVWKANQEDNMGYSDYD
jgi:hypothetical protein